MTAPERGPGPAGGRPPRSAPPGGAAADPAATGAHAAPTCETCERCGWPMYERHCRIVCPRCGYLRDCSDP